MAALRMQPVDRLPFWPKLDAAYAPMQSGMFKEMNPDATHEWIGSDNLFWGMPSCWKERSGRYGYSEKVEQGLKTIEYIHGKRVLTARMAWDNPSRAFHPIEFPVKTKDDMLMLAEWFQDRIIEPDPESIEKAVEFKKNIGEKGTTQVGIGESPLMFFVEWLAGVQNAHYFLFDEMEAVEHLFSAIHGYNLRRARIAAGNSPADLIFFIENTSTTLISPDQYRKYCLGHIRDYGEALSNPKQIFVLHMCGTLKRLLPMLDTVPAKVFEAFTSPPVGDTTLLDGRTACPEKILIGGTNATTWMKSAEGIIEEIGTSLDELPHTRGIVVTSAGVMPPLCPPETIKEVCAWVHSYPARN
jgi:uroporphyrinogen-III decarboxylase